MQMYLGIMSSLITMAVLCYYFRSEKLGRLRGLLDSLFWVDKLKENRALYFGARFTLIFYLFYIVNFTVYGIITADSKSLIWIALFAIGVPAVYRLIMSIQRLFYKI